ncbi:ribose 5-phosphate isomerase B [Lachnospiraceae bacterium G41]|jgi:ribose 5-phosphate isomerase B|nr:ribose 5-phosphate isomerase B [Lachnospiraceae bacterium G41]
MKISIASDHGGYVLKEAVKKHLIEKGIEVVDFGTDSLASCDYPDFGKPAAEAVAEGKVDKGILICTTGIGMSMLANKIKGIRAALCADTVSARLTREHNDANILVMGAGIVGEILAMSIVDTFLNTEFSNEEKHIRRINKIAKAEE